STDPRRDLHARVLGSMEQLYSERRSEHVYELARHALASHNWEAGARYSHEAAQRAQMRFANRDAAQLFEQALEALEQTPETQTRLATALEMLIQLRTCYWRGNQPRRSLDASTRAEHAARALGDRRGLATIYAARLSPLCHFGEYDRAFEN